MKIFDVKDMFFSYSNKIVIKNANFTINKGDFICIIGDNGTGKTTLIKLLLSILKPTKGNIIKNYTKASYVSQRAVNFNQDFPANVKEIVELGLYNNTFDYVFKRKKIEEKIDIALKKVNMLPQKYIKIGNLSGGQQQRVFIAKSIVDEPEVIFLDEATSGVDLDTVGAVCCLLNNINKSQMITVIIVTHDFKSVIDHANKIIFFDKKGNLEILTQNQFKDMHKYLYA